MVRKRGTAIIKNQRGGVLLVEEENGLLLLPGGGCSKDESRRSAACRETEEELGVKVVNSRFLFRHLEEGDECYEFRGKLIQNHHTVFRVWIEGAPTPCEEIVGVRWWYPSDHGDCPNLSPACRRILQRYFERAR